ncbi:MAG: hypothetical protein JSS49_00705 [Planctomycetes bacterium]|nr:hypothetical protein [Planctomycetota bacterium]
MDRNSALSVLMLGCCLAAAGCTLPSRGMSGGPILARRCSDCTPPWVPAFKYCSFIDDLVVCETGKNCGIKALARYRRQCRTHLSSDFGAGFIQAYIDLASGRGPLPPSVPPSRYWTAYYRSCAGQPKVDEWYAGYQAGLDEGSQSGVSQFRRIEVRTAGCEPYRG